MNSVASEDLVRVVDGRRVPSVGVWEFEGGNSFVAFTMRHLAISKVRGNFRDFKGVIEVGERPEASSVTATIEAASLDTGMAFRDRHLTGPLFLDVENHPQLRFASTAVSVAQGGWVVRGNLTVLDTTRPVSLAMQFGGAVIDPWGHEKAAFSATTEFNREDFGIHSEDVVSDGGLVLGAQVRIEIEIQARLPKQA